MESSIDEAAVRYDRDGDQHFDVASAFIKSLRGSDVDAALHYLARMIVAGEDPRFIARRLMIQASEEVGMADPTALQTAVAAAQVVQQVGMPEAQLALAQATIHIATAPKSGSVTAALGAAIADVKAGKAGPVPAHLRDGHYQARRSSATRSATSSRTRTPTACSRSSTPRTSWSASTTTSRPVAVWNGSCRPACPSCAASCAVSGDVVRRVLTAPYRATFGGAIS